MLNPKTGLALAVVLVTMFGIAVLASVLWGVPWMLAGTVAVLAVIAFFVADVTKSTFARRPKYATPPRYSPPPPPPPPRRRRACSAPRATAPGSARSRSQTTAACGWQSARHVSAPGR